VVSGRIPSSCRTSPTGTISSWKRLRSRARAALVWDCAAKVSSCVRVRLYFFGDVFGGDAHWYEAVHCGSGRFFHYGPVYVWHGNFVHWMGGHAFHTTSNSNVNGTSLDCIGDVCYGLEATRTLTVGCVQRNAGRD